jgi:hypothetical protein
MLKAHGVVPIHRPLKLQAERELQVPTSLGQECSSPVPLHAPESGD